MGGAPGNMQDLLESLRRGGAGGDMGGVDLESLFGGGSALDQIFGTPRRKGKRPMRGSDVGAEVQISLPEALRGTERELTLAIPGSREPKTIRARLPVGIADGDQVRLRGQGTAGKDGGEAGDLVLTVKVAPHAVLRRDGDDLHLHLPITVAEAIRGAKVPVPTLDGDISLRVPPRSQSGTTLRVRGRGAPKRGGGAGGDLLVHLEVQVPTEGDEEALQALAESAEKLYTKNIREHLKL